MPKDRIIGDVMRETWDQGAVVKRGIRAPVARGTKYKRERGYEWSTNNLTTVLGREAGKAFTSVKCLDLNVTRSSDLEVMSRSSVCAWIVFLSLSRMDQREK